MTINKVETITFFTPVYFNKPDKEKTCSNKVTEIFDDIFSFKGNKAIISCTDGKSSYKFEKKPHLIPLWVKITCFVIPVFALIALIIKAIARSPYNWPLPEEIVTPNEPYLPNQGNFGQTEPPAKSVIDEFNFKRDIGSIPPYEKLGYDERPKLIEDRKKEFEVQHDHLQLSHKKNDQNFPALMERPDYMHSSFNHLYILTMEGISIIANYLSRKNKLQNMFVCNCLSSMQSKLREVIQDPSDQRLALIAPTYSQYSYPHKKLGDYNYAQHKFTLGIEKINGHLKICLLDDGGRQAHNKANTIVDQNTKFNEQELIFAYLHELKMKNYTFYMCGIRRENDPEGGCSTFALRDAVSFLKDKQFFGNIEKFGDIDKVKNSGKLDNPYGIQNMPPDFMRLCQSQTAISKYIKRNEDKNKPHYDLTKPFGPKQKPFNESIKKHLFQLELEKKPPGGQDIFMLEWKDANLHIPNRVIKYQMMILHFMKKYTTKDLLELINEKMISAKQFKQRIKIDKLMNKAVVSESSVKESFMLPTQEALPRTERRPRSMHELRKLVAKNAI